MKILRGLRPTGDSPSEDAEPTPETQSFVAPPVPVRPLADGYRIFLPEHGSETTPSLAARSTLPAPPTEPVAPVVETPQPSAPPVPDAEPVVSGLVTPTMPRFADPASADLSEVVTYTPNEIDLIRQQALAKAARLLASRGPLTSPDLAYRYARDVTPLGADTALRHMLDGGSLADLSDAALSLPPVGGDVYANVVADLGFNPLD